MTEQLITTAAATGSQMTGFTPLEVVLMSVIAILFTTIMTICVRLIKEVISSTKDMHNTLQNTTITLKDAMRNNTNALEKIPDIVQDKIELALRK